MSDQKDINAQVGIFNETILNVFRYYVLLMIKTMNEFIKSKFKQKMHSVKINSEWKSWKLLRFSWNLITKLNEFVSSEALYYLNFAIKLKNTLLQEKSYWSILNTFYCNKKLLLISPYLVDSKYVINMKTKTKYFQRLFCRAMCILKWTVYFPLIKYS